MVKQGESSWKNLSQKWSLPYQGESDLNFHIIYICISIQFYKIRQNVLHFIKENPFLIKLKSIGPDWIEINERCHPSYLSPALGILKSRKIQSGKVLRKSWLNFLWEFKEFDTNNALLCLIASYFFQSARRVPRRRFSWPFIIWLNMTEHAIFICSRIGK